MILLIESFKCHYFYSNQKCFLIQKILSEFNEAKQLLAKTRTDHVEFWRKVGIFKQQTQQQQQLEYKREKQAAAAGTSSSNTETPTKASIKSNSTPTKDSKINGSKSPNKNIMMSPSNPNKKFAGPAEPKNIIARRKSSVVSTSNSKTTSKSITETTNSANKRRISQIKGKKVHI